MHQNTRHFPSYCFLNCKYIVLSESWGDIYSISISPISQWTLQYSENVWCILLCPQYPPQFLGQSRYPKRFLFLWWRNEASRLYVCLVLLAFLFSPVEILLHTDFLSSFNIYTLHWTVSRSSIFHLNVLHPGWPTTMSRSGKAFFFRCPLPILIIFFPFR